MYKFLVTTKVDELPTDRPIVMVDGTVPGWTTGPDDLHFDHHRPGGGHVQLDELPPIEFPVRIQIPANAVFVTTQVDADACVAAAWLIRVAQGKPVSGEQFGKLWAIACDCDHLAVPEGNSDAEFAAKAVAAMKESGFALATDLELPKDRRTWTDAQRLQYNALAFEQGVNSLLDALTGSPWPGELGEADDYFNKVKADAELLLKEGRAKLTSGQSNAAVCVGDTRGMGRYVDPRSFIMAWDYLVKTNPETTAKYGVRPETITIRDHKDKTGVSYTLGSIPLHPDLANLDYTKRVFKALTALEPEGNDPWGGRATVGGSGWNSASTLSAQDIIAVLEGEA